MSRLALSPQIGDADAFYAALIEAHQGLSDEASQLLNARLVLILANQVGDMEALLEALALAQGAVADAPPPAGSGAAELP